MIFMLNSSLSRVYKVTYSTWACGHVELRIPASCVDMKYITTNLQNGCVKTGRGTSYHVLGLLLAHAKLPFFEINSNRKLDWGYLGGFSNHVDWKSLIDEYLTADLAAYRMVHGSSSVIAPDTDPNQRPYGQQMHSREFATLAKLKQYVTSTYTKERWYKDRVDSLLANVRKAEYFALTGDRRQVS